ncbi:tRNA pseudouridine(13) synthase TruD, partial [Lysobacter sp. 2RAB21]
NLIAEAKPQDENSLRDSRARSLGLSLADADAALAVVPGAKRYAAEKPVRTHSVFSDAGRSDAQASGVSPDYFDLSSLRIAKGRALTDADDRALAAVAVLGHQAAADLFPGVDPIGQDLKVNHVWLQVVGVLADRDLSKDQFEGVQLGLESNRVYLPLASARARFKFQPQEDEVDRFVLRLREVEGERAAIDARLTRIAERGVPNYFGEQRFGRDGDNVANALAM